MTREELTKLANQSGQDPVDYLLDKFNQIRAGSLELRYVNFEMTHMEECSGEPADDAAIRYFIDGYPADQDVSGTVIATVTLTKNDDIVINWHHNGYRMHEEVLCLIEQAKKELSALKNYVVAIAVEGRFYAHIRAASAAQAVKKANNAFIDADFGVLETINSSIDHVEDPNGNFLDLADIEE